MMPLPYYPPSLQNKVPKNEACSCSRHILYNEVCKTHTIGKRLCSSEWQGAKTSFLKGSPFSPSALDLLIYYTLKSIHGSRTMNAFGAAV